MTDIKAKDERLGAHPACGWSLFQALRDPVTAPGIHSPQIPRSREGAGRNMAFPSCYSHHWFFSGQEGNVSPVSFYSPLVEAG